METRVLGNHASMMMLTVENEGVWRTRGLAGSATWTRRVGLCRHLSDLSLLLRGMRKDSDADTVSLFVVTNFDKGVAESPKTEISPFYIFQTTIGSMTYLHL